MEDILRNIQKQIDANVDCFVLGIQTDTHYSTNTCEVYGKSIPASDLSSMIRFDKIYDTVRFDAVCNLGDMTRGYEFDPIDGMRKDMQAAVDMYLERATYPVFFVCGNHDNGVLWTTNDNVGSGNRTFDEMLLPAERYDMMIKPMKKLAEIKDNEGKLYYYCDIKGIRIIVLDTEDYDYKRIAPSDVDINHHKFSEAQLQWLRRTALDTEQPVLVLCHVPLTDELLYGSPGVAGSDVALKALRGFAEKGGIVIAVLAGHTHKRDHTVCDGIPHICFRDGYEKAEMMILLKNERKIKFYSLSDGIETEYSF